MPHAEEIVANTAAFRWLVAWGYANEKTRVQGPEEAKEWSRAMGLQFATFGR
jgi:hypothetical protein